MVGSTRRDFSAVTQKIRTRQIRENYSGVMVGKSAVYRTESILRPLRLWLSAGDDAYARRFEKGITGYCDYEYATTQPSSV